MEFKSEYRNYLGRYLGTLWVAMIMILVLLFGPMLYGKDLSFSLGIFKTIDLKGSIVFLIIPVVQHINSYLTTNKYLKLLKLDKETIIFVFFKKPSLTLKYAEIRSLEFSDKIHRNFIFILKDGEKEIIPSSVRGYEDAFKIINKRINKI